MTTAQADIRVARRWTREDKRRKYRMEGVAWLSYPHATQASRMCCVGYRYNMGRGWVLVMMGKGRTWETAFKRATIKARIVRREEKRILASPEIMRQIRASEKSIKAGRLSEWKPLD